MPISKEAMSKLLLISVQLIRLNLGYVCSHRPMPLMGALEKVWMRV